MYPHTIFTSEYCTPLFFRESFVLQKYRMSSKEVLMASSSSGSVATPYCIIMQLLSCVDVDGRLHQIKAILFQKVHPKALSLLPLTYLYELINFFLCKESQPQ